MPNQLPGILAQPASLGRAASPQDFDTGRGRAAFGEATQRLAEIGDTLYSAELTSRTRLASVNAEVKLREIAQAVKDENDPDTAEARYGEQAEQVKEQFSAGLPGQFGQQFELDYKDSVSRGQMGVRGWVREKRVEHTRAQTDEVLTRLGDLAADAGPDEMALFRDQAHTALSESGAAFSPEEQLSRRESWDRGLSRAKYREAIRVDPVGARAALEENRFPGLSGEEKQVFISAAIDEHERQVREARYDRNAAAVESDRARAKAAEAISKNLIDLAGPNGPGVSMADLAGIRETGTDTEYMAWVKVVQEGRGRLAKPGGGTDGGIYAGLYDAAAEGDPSAGQAIREATIDGAITPAQHDTLLKVSTDTRFKDARATIAAAFPVDRLSQGFAALNAKFAGKIDPVIATAARRDFEDWVASNADATRDEARVKADVIVRDYKAAEVDLQGRAIPTLSPMRARPTSHAEVDAALAQVAASVSERNQIPPLLMSPDVLRRDPDFRAQAILAQRWRDWLDEQPVKAAGATK